MSGYAVRCNPVFPDLFATLAVPKAEELVATPYRHGSKEKAEAFFLDGMTLAMERLAEQSHPALPVTIYYAFKQSESKSDGGTASTGWETFLGRCGTCRIRDKRDLADAYEPNATRLVGMSAPTPSLRALSLCADRAPPMPPLPPGGSSLMLSSRSCLRRCARCSKATLPPWTWRRPPSGPAWQCSLAMRECWTPAGKAVSVRDALSLINQTLDEVLAEQEGDFDADTRWALAWFEQSGFAEGDYGVAETLSKAKNTSVAGMEGAGILHSGGGKVRLLRPQELPEDWAPDSDNRLIAWEAVHHLVRVHDKEGEDAAASLMGKLGPNAEAARELAYRLYRICDQKNRSQEALSYNALVLSWPEVARLAQQVPPPSQPRMLPDDR